MGAGEVELQGIDPGLLDAADDLLPGLLAVLLHHRGDQHLVRVALLELAKLVQPGGERPVGDELDVLEAQGDLVVFPSAQLAVPRGGVDHLGRVETDRLADHSAPAEVEGLGDHPGVGPGRAGAQQKRIVELDAGDAGLQ
jgi:hypothetical protein